MARIGRFTLLALASLAFGSPRSTAAKQPIDVTPYDVSSFHSPRSAPVPAASSPVCTLGESGAPVNVTNYITPPDDAYYMLLHASDCAPCTPPQTSVLEGAHILLSFPVVCSVPVDVSIVAAAGDATCRTPDPSQVLCAEQTVVLTPPAAGSALLDMPLAADCTITGDAFLRIRFNSLPVECSSQLEQPRLVSTGSCTNCRVYNIYPLENNDLCAINFPGTLIMYVDVGPCMVPALGRSWGQLKTYYR